MKKPGVGQSFATRLASESMGGNEKHPCFTRLFNECVFHVGNSNAKSTIIFIFQIQNN